MKLFIFAIVLTACLAKDFKVQDGSKTCALLSLDGSVNFLASDKGTSVGDVNLNINDATLSDNSSCTEIKLAFANAELWFTFDAKSSNWQVTPQTTFVPADLFGDKVNDTDAQVLQADPITQFPQSGSYLCYSSTTFDFKSETSGDYTYTATATVTNLQIQSADSDSYLTATECAADPSEYICTYQNASVISMEGDFTLTITYNTTDNKQTSVAVVVPGPEAASTSGSSCNPNSDVEVLKIGFFDTWSVEFTFTKDSSDYQVANITVAYTYDSHLPNSSTAGKNETVPMVIPSNYLKAPVDGYYVCIAELELQTDSVDFTTANFKYRAYDKDGDGFQGTMAECSADEDSNSIVPIAVGAALAGLVVIVLIAYLIGRKRSRKTGYESV